MNPEKLALNSAIIFTKLERSITHIESKAKAIEAAQAALDKKAKDMVVLELKDLTIIADYFVVCSGESTTQVKAIVENVEKKLREYGQKPMGIEGLNTARWVLMDYGDVIVHVFEEETRAYYELEKFWLDAPRIPFEKEVN
ncbi:MAG: ribosome silencing factor [Thermodesulfovibrionales bacterium]|nr:ribosome silencing factor [Thermodesulfovibrionales bacterium]